MMSRHDGWPRPSLPLALGLPTLAERTTEDNFCSTSGSQRSGAKVLSTSSSSSSAGTFANLSSDGTSASSSSDESSTSSSSEGTLTTSLSRGVPSALGRSVLRKIGHNPVEPALKVVAEGLVFPRDPACSDPFDGPSTHFPNPKVTPSLKRTALEKKYLMPARYSFVIPEVNATVNEPPQ